MISALVAVLLLQSAPAAAPRCTSIAAPPAGFAAWSAAAVPATDAIPLGNAVRLALHPSSTVKFLLLPQRKPAEPSYAGVYTLTLPAAGRYRIALEGGAWIDVVRDGKALQSVGHDEGPACSTIRKIVDFVLPAGTVSLQLSGATMASMRALIVGK